MNTQAAHRKQTISVIGLGKLGAPLAACLAHKGYPVIGVDSNPRTVEALNQGKAPVYEPGLAEMIAANRERLKAQDDITDAVLRSEVTFIVVATPSDAEGGFSLRYVLPVCEKLAEGLKRKSGRHLVILTSTVMPGATAGEVVPFIEAKSGKKCGVDFGMCYSPEFIALGSVIRDYLNPDFVLIGESDPQAGAELYEIYSAVCDNHPRAARMNFVNAELTKLSVNTFVTTKITFSNTLARMCERLPDANVDAVSQALGMDSRIGGKYLKGAVGYGGPCFPRDTIAFSKLARSIGVSSFLAEATDRTNRAQVNILVELIKAKSAGPGAAVCIFGLSYKPNTNVVEESQGVLLSEALVKEGFTVTVYDPAAMENAKGILKSTVAYAASLEKGIESSAVLVIMTPWEDFRRIEPAAVTAGGRRKVLIDCWRMLDGEKFRKVCDFTALGTTLAPCMKQSLAL